MYVTHAELISFVVMLCAVISLVRNDRRRRK